MSVWGCTMMLDEEDVAYGVICHMAEEGLTGIVVADNMSKDGTREELERAKVDLDGTCQIEIVDDLEVGYMQSQKMTRLAHQASEAGATWIIPFDADEIWYTKGDRVAVVLEGLAADVVYAPLYNHFCTAIDPPEEDDPFRKMVFRQRKPGALPKVAFRWHESAVIQQGNHAVVMSREAPGRTQTGPIELRHFPYRSFAHFSRKAINGSKAYAATDLPFDQGAHWRQYGQLLERYGEEALREVYDTWFSFLAPVNAGMIRDPAPYRRWTNV